MAGRMNGIELFVDESCRTDYLLCAAVVPVGDITAARKMMRELVNGHLELPVGGQENCPWVAIKNCPVADTNLPMRVLSATGSGRVSGQGFDSFPVQCLGQAYGVAAGLAQVRVVEQPVDGGGRQRLGHQLVEAAGVQV